MKNYVLKLYREEKLFFFIIVITALSFMRSFIIPLQGDEITYNELAQNLLRGQFYFKGYPSSITPVLPFFMAVFSIKSLPMVGFALGKLFQMILFVMGCRFAYLFLTKQNVDSRIILTILVLTAVNPVVVNFFPTFYPESILFVSFWGILHYATEKLTVKVFFKVATLLALITLTRYLYAVMGVVALFVFVKLSLKRDFRVIGKMVAITACVCIPLLVWAKYVNNIEKENLSQISYFKRFKEENQLTYNVKAGLGLIKHREVHRVNGIPAFISLFVPITGIRNMAISIVLLLLIIYGYIRRTSTTGLQMLVLVMALVMVGLIFAGTGFSRYWLILLPGFFLGYYFAAQKIGINNKWFVMGAQAVCLLYIVNELRLDYLILNTHLLS